MYTSAQRSFILKALRRFAKETPIRKVLTFPIPAFN